jgi:hypothetical protein
MVLLGTIVTIGKSSDKPVHGKNGSREESGNGKGQNGTERYRAAHALQHWD